MEDAPAGTQMVRTWQLEASMLQALLNAIEWPSTIKVVQSLTVTHAAGHSFNMPLLDFSIPCERAQCCRCHCLWQQQHVR